MEKNNSSQQLYDLLVSKDFDPNALDSMGKPSTTPSDSDLFSFEYKTKNKNYGTVVLLIDGESNLEMYFGDNLGKTMDAQDKKDWYDFLYMVRMFAKRNMLTFSLNNINRLKYNMKTMAAITEGTLLEGYYGTTKTSYSNQPMETKLIIKHSRPLGEDDARFRNVKTLFVQTAEGERFKLPFTNLSGGKAMARHVAEGGNPYDAFGQHIVEMMGEIATLQKFIRASKNKGYDGEAGELVEQAVKHYSALKRKAKRIIGRRGYHEELDAYDPITVNDIDETVDSVRELFIQQSLDERVEQALPILAKIQETNMKEADVFEQWADSIIEGTWAFDEEKIQQIMKEPLPAGPDGNNAMGVLGDALGDDQLYDDISDLAEKDPDADVRPLIKKRMEEIKAQNLDEVEEVVDIDTGKQALKAERDPMLEDELKRLLQLSK